MPKKSPFPAVPKKPVDEEDAQKVVNWLMAVLERVRELVDRLDEEFAVLESGPQAQRAIKRWSGVLTDAARLLKSIAKDLPAPEERWKGF